MSEKCIKCGELADPCICNRSDETLVNELRSRGYNVKVTRTFTEEKEYFHD